MERKKINVPKFEGFECAGILIPKEHNDVYILNGMGDELELAKVIREPATNWAQLCYRKIKPTRIVFERVGPGIANAGEWIRTGCGDFIKLNSDRSTECDIWHQVEEKS